MAIIQVNTSKITVSEELENPAAAQFYCLLALANDK